MSRLQVFWPDDQPHAGCTVDSQGTHQSEASCQRAEIDLPAELSRSDESGQVLQFEIHARRIQADPQYDLTQRARKLHRNNICPNCHSICIVPLDSLAQDPHPVDEELSNTRSNRKPLIAFRCERCAAKWPA